MRLPNGFGSVVKRAGNLRKPYVVKVSVNGKQKAIGYASTHEEGLLLLAKYHKDPKLFASSKITFAEVYALASADRFKNLAEVTVLNYTTAYKHCESLYNKRFVTLRPSDLQKVIDDMSAQGLGYAAQRKVKQVMHHCYHYAIKYGLVEHNYSTYVDLDKYEVRKKKEPFNTRQLNRVRALIGIHELSDIAKCVVMMCYCGVRPSEFLNIRKADVKLGKRYFTVRESKTEAGRDRIVPISKKTLEYFEYFMSLPGSMLVTFDGSSLTYRRFRVLFARVMKAARCRHTPHECRHTCATWLNNAGANLVSIKHILGHSCKGVTERVYTHKSIQQLRKAIDLL